MRLKGAGSISPTLYDIDAQRAYACRQVTMSLVPDADILFLADLRGELAFIEFSTAVANTRWQIASYKGGGGDGGCDEPGPAPTPSYVTAMARSVGRVFAAPYRLVKPAKPPPAAGTRLATHVELGRCHMDAGRTVCVPDGPKP